MAWSYVFLGSVQALPRLLKARRQLWIEPDRLVVVGDGAVVILLLAPGVSTFVVGGRSMRDGQISRSDCRSEKANSLIVVTSVQGSSSPAHIVDAAGTRYEAEYREPRTRNDIWPIKVAAHGGFPWNMEAVSNKHCLLAPIARMTDGRIRNATPAARAVLQMPYQRLA